MKQKVYCVVEKTWCGTHSQLATTSLVSVHLWERQANMAARARYDELKACRDISFAEWCEFDGVRGLVRCKDTSKSIYVVEREIELD